MKFNSFLYTTCLATVSAGPVFAANDCAAPAQQCSGDFVLTATVAELVSVARFDDLNLGTHSNGNNLTGTENICAYYNNNTTYQLTFTSTNGGGGNFTLDDGAGQTFNYTVSYDDGGGTPAAVTEGNALTGLDGANTADPTCGGADNGAITIVATDANLAAQNNGTFTDTITVVIDPTP